MTYRREKTGTVKNDLIVVLKNLTVRLSLLILSISFYLITNLVNFKITLLQTTHES